MSPVDNPTNSRIGQVSQSADLPERSVNRFLDLEALVSEDEEEEVDDKALNDFVIDDQDLQEASGALSQLNFKLEISSQSNETFLSVLADKYGLQASGSTSGAQAPHVLTDEGVGVSSTSISQHPHALISLPP
ncbi:hypothetical protein P691DRAFT_765047 [Macrolepiota fuliginosa MF-IS2]|uniref:Uncharacterized protein n=1 Tax=Macrolepiota fuliginosa MF-IS2 TaxID=1400762 RepID=A0A9P5X4B1_9AGAR|nr:hypothetical protein P691DRAFT_765047 [Macrolepiota fuliginosa MF-IS2]